MRIEINQNSRFPFHNQVDFCVGTGRMGLALQREYMEQLALVQEEIGFSFIRGHGLFSDDMTIYHEYEDEKGTICVEYNFTYLDLVLDQYLKLDIRPFLELGFMPSKLASGDQTIFYWKGNTTPPKEYKKWCDLVQATLQHCIDRYGINEVLTWPIEVWNEPNLPGFWYKADMQEYFKLFKETFYAIKQIHPKFRIGGPAICGVDDENWIRSFMQFCKDEKIPLDFVTRHHYTTELPEYSGHYGYAKLSEPEMGFENLMTTRDIIDSFPEFEGIPIHITEFNTSYIPNCPLHDTNLNAAYIAHQLSRLGDMNESYSYWTFGDIFEEMGVGYTPFHGGFGMVANGSITKPTFWSFKFYKELKKAGRDCVYKDEHCVVVKDENKLGYSGIIWNYSLDGDCKDLEAEFSFSVPAGYEKVTVLMKSVDQENNNPLNAWHCMGEPSSLTEEQRHILQDIAKPTIYVKEETIRNEKVDIDIKVGKNAVLYFNIQPMNLISDRGYDYSKIIAK